MAVSVDFLVWGWVGWLGLVWFGLVGCDSSADRDTGWTVDRRGELMTEGASGKWHMEWLMMMMMIMRATQGIRGIRVAMPMTISSFYYQWNGCSVMLQILLLYLLLAWPGLLGSLEKITGQQHLGAAALSVLGFNSDQLAAGTLSRLPRKHLSALKTAPCPPPLRLSRVRKHNKHVLYVVRTGLD